jgi:hypothetical protein
VGFLNPQEVPLGLERSRAVLPRRAEHSSTGRRTEAFDVVLLAKSVAGHLSMPIKLEFVRFQDGQADSMSPDLFDRRASLT